MVPTSSIERTTPSVNEKPAASSTSWPGVLMMMTRVWPARRMSSGSSTTTQSSTSVRRSSLTLHRVLVSTAWRSMPMILTGSWPRPAE
jgi:hypothetical protein